MIGLNQNFLNANQVSPVMEGGASADTVSIQTQVRILQSESLLDRVTEKLSIAIPSAAVETRESAWRQVLNLPESEPVDVRGQAFAYAKKNLKVRTSNQTRIIEIMVDAPDPDLATNFANALTNEFIEQTLEARFKTSERTGEFLSRQIDDMRVRLEQSEDRLQQYATRAGLVFTDDNTNVSEEKLLQVQQALSTAQTDRILKQSRWETANASPPEALSDVLNDSTLRDYQSKLTELNRQLAELRQTYTDEALQVKRVLAQLEPVQTALSRERNDILKRIRNEFEEAQRRETLLEVDYTAQRRVVTGEGEKAIQYNILKREVESNRELYDSMLQQLKQATLASALQASNIRVVDPAKTPKKPYKPNVPISSALGMLSGLFFGAVFVIIRERADRSIQDPGETSLYISLPELGVVPRDESASRVRAHVATQGIGRQLSATKEGPPHSALAQAPQRTELATFQRRPSLLAESFRATLVSILFSCENGSRPRVMVVTSSNPAEGKSTVLSNLGIAVAEVNQRVLLIDADLRKPRLHEIFGLKNDRGLSDMLQSREPNPELPDGVIQETDIPGLYVLTSGSTTSAATSLLFSNRMPELLRKLRAEFETIFVDTPPMLQIPDARVLGRMVDRVILVVRAGKTTRDAIAAAYQRFSEDGTKVLGTVLNDWNPKRSPNGYYGDYNGYYAAYSKRGYYGSRTLDE